MHIWPQRNNCCEFCQKTFRRVLSYEKHRGIHWGIVNIQFSCQLINTQIISIQYPLIVVAVPNQSRWQKRSKKRKCFFNILSLRSLRMYDPNSNQLILLNEFLNKELWPVYAFLLVGKFWNSVEALTPPEKAAWKIRKSDNIAIEIHDGKDIERA